MQDGRHPSELLGTPEENGSRPPRLDKSNFCHLLIVSPKVWTEQARPMLMTDVESTSLSTDAMLRRTFTAYLPGIIAACGANPMDARQFVAMPAVVGVFKKTKETCP